MVDGFKDTRITKHECEDKVREALEESTFLLKARSNEQKRLIERLLISLSIIGSNNIILSGFIFNILKEAKDSNRMDIYEWLLESKTLKEQDVEAEVIEDIAQKIQYQSVTDITKLLQKHIRKSTYKEHLNELIRVIDHITELGQKSIDSYNELDK